MAGVVLLSAAGPATAGREAPAAHKLDIVFAQVAAGRESAARLVRLSPDGKLRVLSQEFHSARDPDVSFDGTRILFAGKKLASDRWQIYEMAADGTGVRQVTREAMDCRSPIYQSALFLLNNPEPSYQIAFIGEEAGRPPALFAANPEGGILTQLTANPHGDMDPFLMDDGRMLYSGRQAGRLDPRPRTRVPLFGINIDGTDMALFAGDEGAPFKRMPCVTTERLAVFIENEVDRPDGAGYLAAVSLRRNLHSHRKLTEPSDGLHLYPSPLPDGAVLVSRRPADGRQTFGIYRFEPVSGIATRVFDDPKRHDIQAKRIGRRGEPDGRASVVNPGDPNGGLYCLNPSITDLPEKEGLAPGVARRLRVLEGVAGPTPAGTPELRFLGEVNLENDGSFNVRVPANIPIQLQLLDAEGVALRTCRWIWVRNGENRGCIGCHESGELVPENKLAAALTKPAAQLTLPPERRRTVGYGDVAGILASKCATGFCHGGGMPPRLGSPAEVRALVSGTARTSPLAWQLFGRKLARPWDSANGEAAIEQMPPPGSEALTEDEKRTILEWLDLGAQP